MALMGGRIGGVRTYDLCPSVKGLKASDDHPTRRRGRVIDEEKDFTSFKNTDFGNCRISTIEAIYKVCDLQNRPYYVVLFKDGKTGHFPWSPDNERAVRLTKKLVEISQLQRFQSFNELNEKVRQVIAFMSEDKALMLMAILDDGRLMLVQHQFADESWLSANVSVKMTIEVDEKVQKTFDAEWVAGDPFKIGGRKLKI